jgi:hypothetical protein
LDSELGSLDNYEIVVRMLKERGIDRVEELLQPFQTDEQLDLVVGAVKWWDDLPKLGERAVGPGLLVKKIQGGGVEGYKRPGERSAPRGKLTITDDLRANIRSHALAPDGMRREWMHYTYHKTAAALNMTVDQLIDSVMGPQWKESPPFPMQGPRDITWTWPEAAQIVQGVRYGMWVGKHPGCTWKLNDKAVRREGESDYDFSIRFWGYSETAEVRESLRKIVMTVREEEAAKREAAKTLPPEPEPEPVAVAAEKTPEEAEMDDKWGEDAPW